MLVSRSKNRQHISKSWDTENELPALTMITSVKDEIRTAIEKLRLPPSVFRELQDTEAEIIFHNALRHFVPKGKPRWWWEHFASDTGVQFLNGDGWRYIPDMVPDPNEQMWFIAEDSQLPFFPVYETTPALVPSVIAECHGFEFYMIQKDFEWLLCRNHHDFIVGVGHFVEEKLKKYLADS
jgi:hypothetical protein